MPRPLKKRKICLNLRTACFRPDNVPASEAGETVLEIDEIEAVRLADLQGKYQEEAAAQMGISRQTFGNIINRARAKIAEALVRGRVLRIKCPRLSGRTK